MTVYTATQGASPHACARNDGSGAGGEAGKFKSYAGLAESVRRHM